VETCCPLGIDDHPHSGQLGFPAIARKLKHVSTLTVVIVPSTFFGDLQLGRCALEANSKKSFGPIWVLGPA